MKKSIILLLALSAMFSCQKNDIDVPVNDDMIYASVEDMAGTKTSLAENKDVLWSFDDRITIFKKTTLGLQYRLIDEYSGRNYGGFSKVASDDDNVYAGSAINHLVAYYPYQSNIVIKADDVEKPTGYTLTGIDLPQTQYYEQGSFSNGSFPMVALSEENNLTFMNVCGGIKFLFKGSKSVQQIRFAGKNKEQLAGTASVLAYVYGKDPVVTMTKGVYDIYLDCGKGVQLDAKKPTEFIISLPPMTFSKGFTAKVTYTDGTTETMETDKENTIYRSKLTVMPEIELGTTADSGDYVDEYGKNHGPGVEIDGVVWAPVNCGYHAADYPYGKLYQWGRKYGQGYSVPVVIDGPVSIYVGESQTNADVHFKGLRENAYDWADVVNTELWNSGTETEPVKAEYDPCPSGWRVPTKTECEALVNAGYSWDSDAKGVWFGSESGSEVFLPAAGCRNSDGTGADRETWGYYWTSSRDEQYASGIRFFSNNAFSNPSPCGTALAVRCVKE